MKTECKYCPFKKTNEWRGGWIVSKMTAIENIEESGNIHSCHTLHPDNHVFSGKPMIHNDCIGFQKMLSNMKKPNLFPEIVNNFLETNPQNYNFVGWAKEEGKTFKLFTQQNP